MNQLELFKLMNKLTGLGILLSLTFVLMSGVVLHQSLSGDKVSKEKSPFVGASDDNRVMTAEVAEGKTLFLENCASCHNNDMVSDMTGPALYGVTDRWKNREELYQWIQNSQQLAAQGNTRAKMLLGSSMAEMPAFEHLDTTQIRAILAYIEF